MATVYVAACDRYDPDLISGHVRAAALALGLTLPSTGSATLHPAIPLSHQRFAPNAGTNPAVIEGMAAALAGASVTIAGQSLPGFPTRYSLGHAGWAGAAGHVKARLVCLDESSFSSPAGPPLGPEGTPVKLANVWRNASFRVSMPRLTGSTFLPFSGALLQNLALIPQPTQQIVHGLLPDLLLPLSKAAAPSLIVVDAIIATHMGGEISGRPIDLGLIVIGTDPVAVDLVCAAAYGVPDEEMGFVRSGPPQDGVPATLADINLTGTVDLAELRKRGSRVQRLDPNPEKYPLPKKIAVVRSEKARLASSAGSLTEALAVTELAGYNLAKSRQVALVLGAVEEIPPGTTDKSTVIFVGDTARGETTGYGRVVRVTGRNVAVSQILSDLPFLLDIGNFRTDLGFQFQIARLRRSLGVMVGRSSGESKAAAGSPQPKGGGDQAAH
jgi:uncharacterized protein (DUF362 family)